MLFEGLIPQPERSEKPRSAGLTMVLDTGLAASELEALVEASAAYVDYVKLGWATSIVHPQVRDKLAILENAGISRCAGGTFFELAYIHGCVDEFFARLKDLGFDHVEVSDGSVAMPHEDKLRYIKQASDDFVVYSEYGSKLAEQITAPRLWVEGMQAELEAGAWKVIAEGRESGTSGLYRTSSEIRGGLVDELVIDIDPNKIIWEAPQKFQQTWLIKRFGSDVNLGNIPPSQVIALETLRRGLRSDTLEHFHIEGP